MSSRTHQLVAQDATPARVLGAAFAHLDGTAAYVLTATGRTVAATPGARTLPAREAAARLGGTSGVTVAVEAAGATPYDLWWLHLPDAAGAPPRLLHEIARFLGRCREALSRRRAARRQAADDIGGLISGHRAGDVDAAARACGLPAEGPYRVVAAATSTRQEGLAEGALSEAIALTNPAFAVVGRLPDGTAFAVLPEDAARGLGETWRPVAACAPDILLYGGLSSPANAVTGLPGCLAQARYALTSARTTAPGTSALTDATTLTTLGTLLTGVPAEVRTAFSSTLLGPLLDPANASAAALLTTLEVFLAYDGSWARTAEALHVHVNTVHYRIQRIEHLTGRVLSRLRDRLDLCAALACRTDPACPPATTAVDPSGASAATTARPARSSTSSAPRR
ncbi:PucR family transcriptional regulator [Streptomyces sp. AM6-12]|uniref:PucR family transcriptional regulator n=1 Tax=Streptomyces sp. AM6-12 TaxID=3345149 RepID=UPI0037899BF5